MSSFGVESSWYTAKDLKDAGYSAKELKDAGFTAEQLKDAGFDAAALKDAGFTAGELKDAGFTPQALKNAGYSAGELLSAGFTPSQLQAAGFSAKELKDNGITAEQLKQAGFSDDAIKSAGFSDDELDKAGISNQSTTAPDSVKEVVNRSRRPQASNNAATNNLQNRQQQILSQQAKQTKLNEIKSSMKTVANTIITSWSKNDAQQFRDSPIDTNNDQMNMTSGSPGSIRSSARGGPGLSAADKGFTTKVADSSKVLKPGQEMVFIPMGTIMYAVLENGINSDETSPVLANIISGPLKGARVIASSGATLTGFDDEQVSLKFTNIVLPGQEKSQAINAVAVDENTARAALNGNVNEHFWRRYGSMMAASFVSGF